MLLKLAPVVLWEVAWTQGQFILTLCCISYAFLFIFFNFLEFLLENTRTFPKQIENSRIFKNLPNIPKFQNCLKNNHDKLHPLCPFF